MRWLFLIFFLFPSIALAGQAEQEEVDQVLEGLKPCLLAFVHLNKRNKNLECLIQLHHRANPFQSTAQDLTPNPSLTFRSARFLQIFTFQHFKIKNILIVHG